MKNPDALPPAQVVVTSKKAINDAYENPKINDNVYEKVDDGVTHASPDDVIVTHASPDDAVRSEQRVNIIIIRAH